MRSKVYIVQPDMLIENMFRKWGWGIATDPEDATLIQFTGGSDVDPSYYGESRHASTYSDPVRDAREAAIYHQWVGFRNMAGICRGGQFLNVMNGGRMWQHVNGHAISPPRGHMAVSKASWHKGKEVEVTSTHHQMMIPGDGGRVLLTASCSTTRQSDHHQEVGLQDDVEAVFYPSTSCLCYQPHPEFVEFEHECQDLYFDYIENLFS